MVLAVSCPSMKIKPLKQNDIVCMHGEMQDFLATSVRIELQRLTIEVLTADI